MAGELFLSVEESAQVVSFCDDLVDYFCAVRARARAGDREQVVDLYQVAHETMDNLGTFLGLEDEPSTAGTR